MRIEQSLQSLRRSLLLPISNSCETVKDNKRSILLDLGFSPEKTNDEKYFRFNFPEDSVLDLINFLKSILREGRYAAIRFQTDGGVSSGGYPTLFVHDNSFVSHKTRRDNSFFIPSSEDKIEIISCDGTPIDCRKNIIVDIFHRPDSTSSHLNGLPGFENKSVKLGGGYRILFETIERKDGRSVLKASFSIMFDDVGPRSTHQESKYDKKQPFFKKEIYFVFNSKKLILEPLLTNIENSSLKETTPEIISFLVLKKLFHQDKIPISKLLSGLFTLKGKRRMHSIEGIYSFSNKNSDSLNVQVIDFDGLTTIEQWIGERKQPTESLGDRLLKARLKLMGIT